MSDLKITTARVSSAENDLGGRFWNPKIRWGVKHAVFVELTSDRGLVGLGECWCFDAAPDALIAYLRSEVLPEVLGLEIQEIWAVLEALKRRATLTARHGMLASAASGVDLACWDLRAQVAGIPLWQALCKNGPGRAHLYASGGLYGDDKGPADLALELKTYVERGFPAVKMKVGALSEAEDIERVGAARSGIGTGPQLIVDGVYSYTADRAARFFDAVRKYDILAFQAPLPPADLKGMRRLCREGIPVMGVESEYREEMLSELIEGAAVAVLQLAPVACGGPSQILRLTDRLRAAGIGLSLETSSTAVATMAAAQIAGACSDVLNIEVHQLHQLFFDRTYFGNVKVSSPWLLPDRPGLGLKLDPGQVTLGFETGKPVRARGASSLGEAGTVERKAAPPSREAAS